MKPQTMIRVKLLVPGTVQRCGNIETGPIQAELDHLRTSSHSLPLGKSRRGGVRPVAPPTWLVSNFLVRPSLRISNIFINLILEEVCL